MTEQQLWDAWLDGAITWDEYGALMNELHPLSQERAEWLRNAPHVALWDAVIDRMEARREAVQA